MRWPGSGAIADERAALAIVNAPDSMAPPVAHDKRGALPDAVAEAITDLGAEGWPDDDDPAIVESMATRLDEYKRGDRTAVKLARLWCPLCGVVSFMDEDGCCLMCGATVGKAPPDTLEARLVRQRIVVMPWRYSDSQRAWKAARGPSGGSYKAAFGPTPTAAVAALEAQIGREEGGDGKARP